ncbi:Stk1 family PASTA domain-containing Ser/Thr kinase [Sporolactobacillus sp. THM7-4]|nr:Stk1 family PASTA domain-containing Ser/Thr kinase [Sporolactobacillus sp. THM7-4]
MIGKRIGGRYQILSRLGDGGMAIVFKAKDLILDRLVAVKILRTELAGDEEFVRRFHREAESVASLSHPNIVAIYDIGEEEDCYYIVMEYVQGMTLKDFIRDYSPISINESVHIMKQITRAIAHAHARGVVHRDIKPQNILIDETEHVKVTDFGIAVAVTSATITYTNSIMGSAHYLSPEQARGGKATVKSDIYGLGIVMFELLTGKLPFPGTSPVSVALKHLSQPMPFPKDFREEIPQSLENVIIRALAKNPDDRYAGVAEMYDDISTSLSPARADEKRLVLENERSVSGPGSPEDEDSEKTIKMGPIKARDSADPEDDPKMDSAVQPSKSKKKKNRTKRWLTYTGVLLLLITSGLIIGLTLLPRLFYVENVSVPDVTGKTYSQAVQTMENRHLKVARLDRSSSSVRKDHVIRQDPEADSQVKADTEVSLFVSIGPETVKMENYVGYDREPLANSLKDQGYKDIIWHEVESTTVPEGQIIRQNPAAGKDIVPSDTVLELTVSSGKPRVSVPDLTGKTRDEADRLLQSIGLSADFVTGDFSDQIDKGKVIDQDPASGNEISKGSTVIVSLSQGSEQKQKDIEQPIRIVYPEGKKDYGNGRSDSKNQAMHIQIYYTDANHNNVLFADEQITDTKTYYVPFTLNPGEKGSYRVLINGSVKKEGTVDYPQ